jgi:hypothetical protein
MENLFMFLATSLVLRIPQPKFKRYLLGANGCSTLLVSGNNTIHFKHTKDGDRVYFYEQEVNDVTFGMISVQMKEVFTLNQAENILVHYINKIRRPFHISHNISMEMEKKNQVLTLTDYWQDEQGIDWKVKGYTNGKTVAVLYVKNIADSFVDEQDHFLNGFRFSNFSSSLK